MAGPGGGSRGGGGGRSRSGGFHGGSRGGGGFRYTYHPGRGWQHHRGHGGGCLTQLLVPIIMLVVILSQMFQSVGIGVTPLGRGGAVQYNEEVYQDYANTQYSEAFGSTGAYEDNLLLSVLVDDDHYSYYYIAWMGDHIITDINHMLGSSGTVLGDAMEQCINASSYKYSLDSNLAQVMEMLTDEIVARGLGNAFTCSETRSAKSMLINDSGLEMTESTVNDALAAFTEKTGIPAVIVVEDMGDVFTGSLPVKTILISLVAAGLLIVTIVSGIKALLGHKKEEHPYHSFDDQY